MPVYNVGTPDETFPFPIGQLQGIRIAVPAPNINSTRAAASSSSIKPTEGMQYVRF